VIQGIFASNQGIIGERVGDFASAMLTINPTGSGLFLAMTAGMGKEEAGDTVFHWYEDSHASGRSQVVSGGTGTTVVVVDGSFYIPGTVLLAEETSEIMLVTATNGDSLTVTRGLSGTSVVSLTNVMHVQNIGNAHEEASGIPVAVTQQGAPRLNYTQIFRNAWAISGTAKAVKFHTGSKLAKNKRDAATYHAEDQERALVWGRKHIGTMNGKQFRLTDGVKAQIELYGGVVESAASNSTPGDLSYEDYDDFLMRLFAKNVKGQPNERLQIGGNGILKAVNQMALTNAQYTIQNGTTSFGLAVTKIVTAWGTISHMTHPLMNENPVWSKESYYLHPGGIKRKVLRDTFEENYDKNGLRIQGKDADEGVITSELGVAVAGASTMGILKNVQRGVKAEAA
jgi:hypothetical protein